jgi:hypothetical protein
MQFIISGKAKDIWNAIKYLKDQEALYNLYGKPLADLEPCDFYTDNSKPNVQER